MLVDIVDHCIVLSTVETVQSNLSLFTNRRYSSGPFLQRQGSITSNISQMSGLGESTVSFITSGQYDPHCRGGDGGVVSGLITLI